MMLRAVVDNEDVPSKLRVGPRLLPRFFYGPYWIVAASADTEEDIEANGYDWVIVRCV